MPDLQIGLMYNGKSSVKGSTEPSEKVGLNHRLSTYLALTEPRRALQPKGTQWFPQIGLFVVQAKDLWIYGQNTQIVKYIVGGTQKPL